MTEPIVEEVEVLSAHTDCKQECRRCARFVIYDAHGQTSDGWCKQRSQNSTAETNCAEFLATGSAQ